MDKKFLFKYLLLTFGLSWGCWGICIIDGSHGITSAADYWLYLPYLLGGCAPSLAGYLTMKQAGLVNGFKDWLRLVFNPRTKFRYYLLTLMMLALFIGTGLLFAQGKVSGPWYLLIVTLPLMLLGGGLEEPGWRLVLQPGLQKRWGFIPAVTVVGLIWAGWHLPLFFVAFTTQYGTSFLYFAIMVLGLAYAVGVIRSFSGSVFLCILFHCLFNASGGVFSYQISLLNVSSITLIMVAVSVLLIGLKDGIKALWG